MNSFAKPNSVLYSRFLIFVGLVTALGPVSTDMYLPGFPAISAEFGASRSLVQYTVTAFLTGVVVGQLLYGPVSDRIGRKRPLCVGICIYVAASIGCMLADSVWTLIAWRFVQGVGGCAGLVIGRAMVRDRFGATGSAKAFSLLMLVVAVAPMIAPLIGGWIAGLGWRAIFAVLAPFGVLLLVAAIYLAEETLPSSKNSRGKTSTAFGHYRVLLNCRQLLSYTVVSGLMQSALYAYVVCAPFVLMEVYGIEPQYFGMVFFGNTAGLIVASRINAAIVERFEPDRILGIALLCPAALSMMLIASLLLGFSSIYVVLAVLLGFLMGHGFISPNAAALGLSKHGAQAGTASAIMGAVQNGLGITTIFIATMLDATSALSLALVMGGCSCLAIACHRLVARPTLKPS
jgi:MFS transporter, DHA1 family, multidrug resistance protein